MSPKYTLNYYNSPGPVKMMFDTAGIEFNDNLMTKEEWELVKTDTTRFPLGQLPTLEVEGKVIIQSQAIARYVAKELGFYGNNSYEAALIDQICETLIDFSRDGLSIVFGGFDEETKKKKFEEFFTSEKTKHHLGFINNILKSNNGGAGFMVGDKVSLADFFFYSMNAMVSGIYPLYLDHFSELKGLVRLIAKMDEKRSK